MTVRLSPSALRRELAVRGISQSDLARGAGLSEATISAAIRGHPIAARSLRRIAEYLARVPVLDVAALLQADPLGAEARR